MADPSLGDEVAVPASTPTSVISAVPGADTASPMDVVDSIDSVTESPESLTQSSESSGAAPSSVTVPEVAPVKPPGLSITPVTKPPGLSVAAVSLTPKEGGEVKKVVPGLKIIGLSSELKKAMPMVQNIEEKEDEEDDDEDAEDEEDSNSEEEEEVIIPEPPEMNFEAGQCVADDKTEVPTETHVPVLRRGGRERKQTEFYKP